MLTNKDFNICIDAIKGKEDITKEDETVIKILELIVKSNDIKEKYESDMKEINEELMKLFNEKGE